MAMATDVVTVMGTATTMAAMTNMATITGLATTIGTMMDTATTMGSTTGTATTTMGTIMNMATTTGSTMGTAKTMGTRHTAMGSGVGWPELGCSQCQASHLSKNCKSSITVRMSFEHKLTQVFSEHDYHPVWFVGGSS